MIILQLTLKIVSGSLADLDKGALYRPNSPQLATSPFFSEEHPKALSRASLSRYPSRRKGLAFVPSVSLKLEAMSPAPSSSNGDDSVSDSDEFDTTIRPSDTRLDLENVMDRRSGLLIRKGENTDHRESSQNLDLSNYVAPCPVIGDVWSDRDSSPALQNDLPFSLFNPQICSTPVSSEAPNTSFPLGHPSRRKPVPKLEDYDRLFPPRPPSKPSTSGVYTHPSYCLIFTLLVTDRANVYPPSSTLT